MRSLLKTLFEFIGKAFKPNSDVSSIRIVMLVVLPVEIVTFYWLIYKGIKFDDNATSIFITVFCITAGMTLGPVFLEHIVDKVGAILKTINEIKHGKSNIQNQE